MFISHALPEVAYRFQLVSQDQRLTTYLSQKVQHGNRTV